MEKEIEKEKVHTVCPHCLKEIFSVWVCRLESIIGLRYIYFCGECQKCLGTFHEKVFNLSGLNSSQITKGKEANGAAL